MKSYANLELLNRRSALSQVATMGGMIVMAIGAIAPMYVSGLDAMRYPVMIVGFVAANVGIRFANQWVRKPRPEDVIDDSLKRLNNQNVAYHYLLPKEHVLLTPTGIVVIEVCSLEGKFNYSGGKWHQKFSVNRTLRFLVEETLGDPIARVQAGVEKIKALVAEKIDAPVPVDGMVLFSHPNVDYEVEGPPVPVVQPQALGKRLPAHDKLAPEVAAKLRELLNEAADLDEDEE